MHRDVKPSNVLISPEGKAILTDFGIATVQGDPGMTQAGVIAGTPGFSPPERVRGADATPASTCGRWARPYAASRVAGRSTGLADRRRSWRASRQSQRRGPSSVRWRR
jgi:serine/threonine protein kinase